MLAPSAAILLLLGGTTSSIGEARYQQSLAAAHAALSEGRCDEARAALEACLGVSPENPTCAYYRACVEARSGESDEALRWLRTAVEWGFVDAALLRWDADLAPLRDRSEFNDLSARVDTARESVEARGPVLEHVWTWGAWDPRLSHDGARLLTGGSRHAFLRDVETGDIIAAFPGSSQFRTRAVFVRREEQIATYSDGQVILWDGRTGAFQRDLEAGDGNAGVVRSDHAGRFLVVDANRGGIDRVWETEDWTLVASHQDRGRVLPLFDGRHVVELVDDGFVTLVDVRKGTWAGTWRVGPLSPEYCLSQDDRLLAVKTRQGAVHFFDLEQQRELAGISDGKAFGMGAFVPDSDLFVLVQKSRLSFWSYRTGRIVSQLDVEDSPIRVRPYPDGARLLVRGGRQSWILDRTDGAILRRLDFGGFDLGTTSSESGLAMGTTEWIDQTVNVLLGAQPESAREVAFTDISAGVWRPVALPSGTTIAAPCTDGTVRILDVASGQLVRTLAAHSRGVDSIAIDGAGRLLVTGSRDGSATVWSLETYKELARLDAGYQRGRLGGLVALDPLGRQLLTYGAGSTPTLWVCETREKVAQSELPGQEAVCAAWAPDGATYALGGSAGHVGIFDLSGNRYGPFLTHNAAVRHIAFDPSGKILAVGTGDARATVWDLETREVRHLLSLEEHNILGDLEVAWLAFSPDGSLLVTTTMEWSSASGWDVETGKQRWLVDWNGGNPAIMTAYFGGDGTRLYLSGNIGTRVVDAKDGSTIRDMDPFAGILMPTSSEHYVLLRGQDSVQVLDGESLDERYRMVETRNGGHAVITPSGYVAGTAEALRQIQALLDKSSYPLDSFASAVFDPKRCQAQMAGVEILPPRIGRPPDISLEPSTRVVRTSQSAVRVTALAEDPGGLLGVEIDLGRGDQQLMTDLEWLDEEGTRARASFLLNAEEGQTVRFRALGRNGLLSRPVLITVGPE